MTKLRDATVAALAFLLTAALAGCGHAPPGVQLTYELDPPPQGANASMLIDATAHVMTERLGDAGEVLTAPNGQIIVLLYGRPSAAQLAALKLRVGLSGVLAFRIMASERIPEHQPLIREAKMLPDDHSTVATNGVVVARWAALDSREFPSGKDAQARGLVQRDVGGTPQALVLENDGSDVTGQYLRDARSELDESGRPMFSFTFNGEGARRFGRLTGEHLPTAAGDRYSLGILLDGVVWSAPTIESRITDRGRISGNMTKDEVDAITDVFNAGALPSAAKLVNEKEL